MSSTVQVKFYPLKHGGTDVSMKFACKLAEKACKLGRRVHFHMANQAQAESLDKLLWQFPVDSFLPHQVLQPSSSQGRLPDITISATRQLPPTCDILVNLSNSISDHHQAFSDIREIVSDDDQIRALARERFRYYKGKGFSVETMPL